LVRSSESRDQVKKRALSATAGSGQGNRLTCFDFEGGKMKEDGGGTIRVSKAQGNLFESDQF
jgi:hypothetical protein